MTMKRTKEKPGVVDAARELNIQSRTRYNERQAIWRAALKAAGIVATHPDNGWVDDNRRLVHFDNPYFLAGPESLAPGAVVALGNYSLHRLVRLVEWRPWVAALLPDHGEWSFEDVL
jgi:hypothetical protein